MSVQHKLYTLVLTLSKTRCYHLWLLLPLWKENAGMDLFTLGTIFSQSLSNLTIITGKFALSGEELTQYSTCEKWNLKGFKVVTRTDLIMHNPEVRVKPGTHPGWINQILVRSATSTSRVRSRINHTKGLQGFYKSGPILFTFTDGPTAPQQQPTRSLQGSMEKKNYTMYKKPSFPVRTRLFHIYFLPFSPGSLWWGLITHTQCCSKHQRAARTYKALH